MAPRPLIDEADKDFIAEAMEMLPEPPFTETTWSDWTGAVKQATGRKGQGAVHAAAQGADRP